MTVTTEASTSGSDRVHWVFKNKDQGKTVAVASLGLITLWDVGGGLAQIDKYLYRCSAPGLVAIRIAGLAVSSLAHGLHLAACISLPSSLLKLRNLDRQCT